VAVVNTGAIFGAYFPEKDTFVAFALGVFGLFALVAVSAAVGVTAVRILRYRGGPGDLVSEVLAAGVVLNLAAFVASTLPHDLGASREIIGVLLLGAPVAGRLAGRLAGPWARLPRLAPALAAVLVLLAGAFAVRTTEPAAPHENQDVAEWLAAHHLTTGVGSYWSANNITLATRGRVLVAPMHGRDPFLGYRWESRADWYDPARHDARFVVLDLRDDGQGTLDAAVKQFGPPRERHDFGSSAVLLYDHNLLVGLPALCGPNVAPSMADCFPR
jgi:hypothetical protein